MSWGLIAAIAGCGVMGVARFGGKAAWNLSKKEYMKVSLDGHPAKEDSLKKAVAGTSSWKVKEEIGTAPTFRYTMEKPDEYGRIITTIISIYGRNKRKWSDHAEFKIVPKTNDPESLLKPDMDYDLGNLPDTLRVLDVHNKDVKGVTLKPGEEYKLIYSVTADVNETVTVKFETAGR